MDVANSIVKFLGTNICILYSFSKISNFGKFNKLQTITMFFSVLVLAILQTILINIVPLFLRITLIYVIYCSIIVKVTRLPLGTSIINMLISLTLTYISTSISSILVMLIIKVLSLFNNYYNPLTFLFMSIINFILLSFIFKIKRFSHGLPFLRNKSQNEYFDIFILILCIIIIFSYFIACTYLSLNNTLYWISWLTLLTFTMFITIRKAILIYHKQKLQTQALKDYEKEIADTKEKLETALQEKQTLVKSNHEFYHRQEALNKKLNDLIELQKTSLNTEFADELTNISERLNTLSSEYTVKTASRPKLVKCNIEEIDDMLSYMQSECIKNNIQFTVNIDYKVDYLIDKFISKSQLETLLGDLIRNSIIAVNHTDIEPRKIMVVFGLRDNIYELAVFDTGIPFEKETLINLGLQPASTHLDEGGSGIGFITTFETLKDCKASFIINELSTGNYTKSLIVRFDGNCEYIITSARADEIAKANTIQRNIKIEPKDE